MARFFSFAAALAGSVLTLAPATSPAQAPVGGYYTATPVAKPSQDSIIIRSSIWKWRDTAFTSNKGPERDTILCELVAQRVGALSEFTVAGRALDAKTLAKCNARAK